MFRLLTDLCTATFVYYMQHVLINHNHHDTQGRTTLFGQMDTEIQNQWFATSSVRVPRQKFRQVQFYAYQVLLIPSTLAFRLSNIQNTVPIVADVQKIR